MTPFLINHLWQSTGFALVAALAAFALRNHSPKLRYWAWLAASLKFLAPFALLIGLGTQVPRTELPPQSVAVPAFTLVQIAQPYSPTFTFPERKSARPNRVPEAIAIFWALGFLAIAFIRIRTWLRLRSALRSATPIDLPIPVRALVTSNAQEPGVVGFLRPVLILPAHLADRLNSEQLGAILAHELSHIRRRDNLFAAAHMLVEAVFWFHPLVWWIGSRLLEERELACDEAVLRTGCEPSDYAQGILQVCRFYIESPLPCVSGVTGGDVKKRLRAILAGTIARELTAAKKLTLAALGLAALAAPIVIGVLNAPAIRAQNAPAAIPKWEVISIKPCELKRQPGPYPPAGSSSPGNLRTNCFPLLDSMGIGLIRQAYSEEDFTPINGAPSWVQDAFYQIDAKAEGSPSIATMRGPMMRALLEDRFHLKIHHQTVEGQVYFLTVAHGGSKLKPFKGGDCVIRTATSLTLKPGERYCNSLIHNNPPPMSVEAEASTIDDFVAMLRAVLDLHQVINKTGIEGLFNLKVVFSREDAPDPDGSPSIYAAMQEQLGLKLEAGKGPIETFVIDHIEKPAGN